MTRHNMIIKILGKEQEVRSNHTSIISTATAAAAAARAKRHAIQRKISRWLRPTSMIDGETKPTSKQYLTKTGLHRRTKDVLWCQELSRSGAAFLDFGAEECPYEVRFGMDVNLPRAGSGIRRKLIKIYTVFHTNMRARSNIRMFRKRTRNFDETSFVGSILHCQGAKAATWVTYLKTMQHPPSPSLYLLTQHF